MNRQLVLFEQTRHLEADYFLSGNENIHDPYEGEEWIYPIPQTIDGQRRLFYGALAYNGEQVRDTVTQKLGEQAVKGINDG